jgi:AraC family transcriptional regulator
MSTRHPETGRRPRPYDSNMREDSAISLAVKSPSAPDLGVAIDWLYVGDAVRVTRYRCLARAPNVGAEHRQTAHVIAFPYQGVFEVHRGRERAVAEPGSMVFFNEGEPYRTGHPCGGGDDGSAIAVRPDVLVEALSRHDPGVVDRPGTPFRFASGASSARAYLLQRLLFLRLSRVGAADPLGVEEAALAVVDEVSAAACRSEEGPAAGRPPLSASHRQTADSARRFLATCLAEPVSLKAISEAVGVSPFHLCRVFRAITGTTVSRYRHRLRLRAALERVANAEADLSAVALDHGYSSHSHFTAAFRREFGLTPTQFRHAAGRSGRSVARFFSRART